MSFIRDDHGGVSVEYGMAVLFAGIVASAILLSFGGRVSVGFQKMSIVLSEHVYWIGRPVVSTGGVGGNPPLPDPD